MDTERVKYQKLSFQSLIDSIEDAKTFTNNEVYLKDSVGDIHKINITYLQNHDASKGAGNAAFEVKVNNVEMGDYCADFGDVYDLIKSCLTVEEEDESKQGS